MTEPFTLPPEIEAAKLAFGKALKEWAEGVVGDRKHRTAMVNETELRLDDAILSALRQMGETREPTFTLDEIEAVRAFTDYGATRGCHTGDATRGPLNDHVDAMLTARNKVVGLAPVAEPPKPPQNPERLEQEIPPGPPVSAPPTQQEAELPPEIEAAKVAFATALRQWAQGIVGDRSWRTGRVNETEARLDAAIRSALSRPPREPSEAAVRVAVDAHMGYAAAAAGRAISVRAIIHEELKAAYAVDFGATPPPGGTP